MSIWDDAARAGGDAADWIRRFLARGAAPVHPDADFAGLDAAVPQAARASGPSVHPDADVAGLDVPRGSQTRLPDGAVTTGAGAAALAAGLAGLAMQDDSQPAVTSGGEAELAAEVPPLAVTPEPEAGRAPAQAKPAVAAPAGKPTDRDRLRARRNEYPMVLDERLAMRMAADSLLADDLRASGVARAKAEKASRDQDAARRNAELKKLEDEYNAERASYDSTGRPRLVTKPLSDRAGGYTFRTRADGTVEVVDNAPTEAESRADFQKWASETPGSERQRRYDPAGAAEWDAKIAKANSDQAQRELAISADPMASQYRRESEARQRASNVATREAIYQARANPLARNQMSDDEKARRAAVVRRAQARGNPMEYLGRGDINAWQRMVAADSMLRNGAGPMTPLGVQAQQLHNIADVVKRAMTAVGPQLSPDLQSAQVAKVENDLPVEDHVAKERDRNEGRLPSQSAAGQRLLAKLDDTYIGPVATNAEVDAAVDAAVANGMDRNEAETHFAPRRKSYYQWATGT